MSRVSTFTIRLRTAAFRAVASTLLLSATALPQSTESGQRIPAVRDGLRENYSVRDFETFVQKEKNGELPRQGGTVLSPAGADVRVNNNAGATTDMGLYQIVA